MNSIENPVNPVIYLPDKGLVIIDYMEKQVPQSICIHLVARLKGKSRKLCRDKFWNEYLNSLIFATEAEFKKGTKTFPSSFIHYEHRRTNTGTGTKS